MGTNKNMVKMTKEERELYHSDVKAKSDYMKTKDIKADNLVKVPEAALLNLVLSNLKGVVLFPENIEAAKQLLKRINKKEAI